MMEEKVETEVGSEGGTLKLNWSDCGDSSTHGHITALTPDTVTLGAKTSLTGKGSIDEDVQGASYKVGAKAGGIPVFSHSGDACKPDTIKLPLGLGEIAFKGFSCPLKAGAAELDLDLTLSANIPAKMAKTDISLTAAASSGDKVLCVDIKTSPAMMQGEKDFSNPAGPKKVETEVGSESGTLKLDWSDCGDSSTHGHITALTPDTVTLGAKTSRERPTRSVRRLEAFQYSLTVVMLASRTRSSSPWASVKLISKASLAHSRQGQRSSIWTSLCPQTFRQKWPRRISV